MFAFGSVYPWAYTVLGALCVAAGLLGRFEAPAVALPVGMRVGFGLIVGVVLVQLVPLPIAAIDYINPARGAALRNLDLQIALGSSQWHSLALSPSSTVIGLALLLAWGVFFAGLYRAMSASSGEWLVRAIVVIGIGVAVSGFASRPLISEKVYGIWQPMFGRQPFGPFVNRNHFAGWVLLALPVVAGLIVGLVSSFRNGQSARERLLRLGSPDGGWLMLSLLCGAALTLTLLMTTSRSGLAGLIAASLLFAVAFRSVGGRWARWVGPSVVFGALVAAAAWTGLDRIAARFDKTEWLFDRWPIWLDAAGVISRFPFLGAGYNNYSTAMTLFQEFDLAQHYTAAHNDYLQLAAEGGLAIVIAVCVLAYSALIELRRSLRADTHVRAHWIRIGAAISLAAIGVQEIVDFSLQMPGNAALCAALAALAVRPFTPAPSTSRLS